VDGAVVAPTSRLNTLLDLIDAANVDDSVSASNRAWAVVVVEGSWPRDISRWLHSDGVVVLGHDDDSLGRMVASGMDRRVSKNAEAMSYSIR
jgi:hypothetical protein